MDDLEMIHKETISFRTQTEIIPELQRLTETHTSERLRRLLRNGFRDLAKEKKFEDYEKKKGSVGNQGDRGNRGNRNQFIDSRNLRNDEIVI